MVELDELIHQAHELRPLPASALRLASLLSSGQADLNEIADVVAYDQALTMRLLRAANSAASGSSIPIARAQEAVFRMGTARVLALTLASSVNGLLQRDVSAYGLGEGQLWRHSIAAAAAAETLPDFVAEELPPETLAAALLHDIGKLVMGRYLSEEDLEWIHRAQTDGRLSSLAAESQILDVHHGELGGIVAQHWGLPERIVKGIIYHHTPADGFDIICDAVYLANIVAKQLEKPGTVAAPVDPDVLERLGIPVAELDRLTQVAQSRFEAVRARYAAL